MRRFDDKRDWFFSQRFGMFVHWGLYAIPAWHEQVLWRGGAGTSGAGDSPGGWTRERYEQLAGQFNPERFDPDAWLDLAEEAGMEYLCFTTKHHDGFCMWDTAHTEYKVTNSPYGKDVLAMVADACHRRGIRLGLYYSLPDWHHPAYPNRGRHHEMFGPRTTDDPDERRYLEYVREQVLELVTGYGEISEFFWDVNVGGFVDPSLNDLIRLHQPAALINDRGPGPGDYDTPERSLPDGAEFDRPTEACQSIGRESWGHREDEDYYSHGFLMRSIARIMAMGGNYLLNVGPKANGALADEAHASLTRIGRWYTRVREAFTDTVPASSMLDWSDAGIPRYGEVMLTRRGNTVYALATSDLHTGSIVLPDLTDEPRTVTLLNDGRSLGHRVDLLPTRWTRRPCLRVTGVPVNEITDEPIVVKLEFGPGPARRGDGIS